MTAETKILTVDEMTSLACRHEAHGESWPDAEYRFRESDVLAFSEAVEQAILQSAQVQAWKRDAGRWRHFMHLLDNMGDDDDPNSPGFPYQLHEAFQEGSARTIAVIDAAMEAKDE